jgi:hypothetical protein
MVENSVSRREKNMTTSIGLKGFVIGGMLVLSIMYILGASPRPTPSDPVRRFAIVLSDAPNGDAFVLDTATGQVWPRHGRGGRSDVFYAPKLRVQTPEEPNGPRIP